MKAAEKRLRQKENYGKKGSLMPKRNKSGKKKARVDSDPRPGSSKDPVTDDETSEEGEVELDDEEDDGLCA